MQINKVNTLIPNKNNKNISKNAGNNNNNKNNQSFKGFIDTLSLGVTNAIENGGLAVSFTLQDMLGTNLPRPIMGLRRNAKENKGKNNFNFAAKEMVREFLTGPSMFLIPMGLLKVGKNVFGKAISVPARFIKAFGDIHANNPLNAAGEAISKQDFYRNSFAEMIKNAKSESVISEETKATAKDFSERLMKGLSQSTSARKDTMKSLTEDFIGISKRQASDIVHTDFTRAAVSKTASAPFKTTVNHMISYADDVVEKASKQSADKIPEFVKNLTNKKVLGRVAANVLMYAAVMSFLQVIPKLYNKAEGKDNAGLKGLMNEETFYDKALNENTDNKNEKTVNGKNPSFGSAAAQLAEKVSGNGLLGKLTRGIEFQGPNVSFPLLLGIMGFGIILPRTKRAKDKYDREEILRRDVVTCAVMCFGEKWLRKGISKRNELKSGFVLAAKDAGMEQKSLPQRIFQYLRPINGVQVFSLNQIESKYSDIGNYNGGIKGFCDFISGQGGNLGKIFSYTDKSKEIVDGLLKDAGSTIETADNATITSVLDKAKDSEAVKKLTDLFHTTKKEAIKNPNLLQKVLGIKEKAVDNPWVKRAKTINSKVTALSVLVIVPVFLGFLLPWINEKTTKKRVNEDQQANNNKQKIHNTTDTSYFNDNNKISSVFADMNRF